MKKKKLFKHVLIMILVLFTFNLYAQIQDDEIFISSTNTYHAPEKYIFINKIIIPNNTIQNGVNGWLHMDNLSDEFDLTSLNLSKWQLDYGWGNNGTSCIAYHKTDLSNHKLLTEGNNKFLRLETKKEYF